MLACISSSGLIGPRREVYFVMGLQDKPSQGHGRWMALTAALLGWLFDGMEMGIFSMVGRPAVQDLLQTRTEGPVGLWFGVIMACFLVGAATGGVVFGWLGDRMGRVRAMTLSILTYSLFTGMGGFAAATWQLGALRFIAALGMGGEWSLGVALVMEVWPNRSRAFMAGLIGAAANVGYMLVGFIGLGFSAVQHGLTEALHGIGLTTATVDWLTANQGWRVIMMIGTFPALLTFFILLFVPESLRWREEKARGATTGWAAADLLGVLFGAAGPALIINLWAWDGPARLPHTLPLRLVGSLVGLVIAAVGYAYPLLRYLRRQRESGGQPTNERHALRRMALAATLSGIALLGTWGAAQWAPAWADKLTEGGLHAKEFTQILTALGAIVGTILAALLGDWIGRRLTYFWLCLLSLLSVALFFQGNHEYGTKFVLTGFVLGLTTASFYGWLPLYLPELFPTRIRATGQGFSYNFGRILAAIGTLQTGVLFSSQIHLGDYDLGKGYPAACSVMGLIYLAGMIVIWFAPETRGKPLPE
jgi:MFS family permease